MEDIEELVSNHTVSADEVISKHICTTKEEKQVTEPNAVVLGSMREVGVKRLKPQLIPNWLLSHPAVERGIEFKFNRIIKQLDSNEIENNVIPLNDKKLSKEAAEYCTEILKNSHNQPVSWLKQFGRDAMRFGDNYAVLITNKAGNKVLRWELQNPIFFSPSFEFVNQTTNAKDSVFNFSIRGQDNVKYKIDKKTKKPKSYTQLKKLGSTTDLGLGVNINDPKSMKFIPTGKEIDVKKVVQLNFDRMGDEPFGIPIAQTLWATVNQIIRVEDAGAETMVAFGYNRWIANTPYRTKTKMEEFGKSIENIAKRSIAILPEGVKLENIKPGSTEFDKVHNILLSLIAMRLGISRIQLLGEGADINKATLGEMMKDVRNDFFADGLELESAVNDGFIKSCIIKYNLKTAEQCRNFPFPKFKFTEMDEDEDIRAARFLKQSLTWRNIAVAVDTLMERGFKEEARKLITQFSLALRDQKRKKTQIEYSNSNEPEIVQEEETPETDETK